MITCCRVCLFVICFIVLIVYVRLLFLFWLIVCDSVVVLLLLVLC